MLQMLSSYSAAEILQTVAPRFASDKVSLYDILEAGMAAPSPSDRASYTIMLQVNELSAPARQRMLRVVTTWPNFDTVS